MVILHKTCITAHAQLKELRYSLLWKGLKLNPLMYYICSNALLWSPDITACAHGVMRDFVDAQKAFLLILTKNIVNAVNGISSKKTITQHTSRYVTIKYYIYIIYYVCCVNDRG